jgi:hypothetical protein
LLIHANSIADRRGFSLRRQAAQALKPASAMQRISGRLYHPIVYLDNIAGYNFSAMLYAIGYVLSNTRYVIVR